MQYKHLFTLFFLSIVICDQLIPVVETYGNGNIKYINYHRKKASGIEKVKMEEYYENGFKREQGPFKNGKKDGKWSYYYENGKKRSEGLYKNGWVGYASSRLWADVIRLREYKYREMKISGRLPNKKFYGTGKPDERVAQSD